MSGNRSTAGGDDLEDILKVFHVRSGRHVSSLGAVVIALECLMDRVRQIFLALEMKGYSLEDDDKLASIPAACNVLKVLIGITFLSENVAALPPYEGI